MWGRRSNSFGLGLGDRAAGQGPRSAFYTHSAGPAAVRTAAASLGRPWSGRRPRVEPQGRAAEPAAGARAGGWELPARRPFGGGWRGGQRGGSGPISHLGGTGAAFRAHQPAFRTAVERRGGRRAARLGFWGSHLDTGRLDRRPCPLLLLARRVQPAQEPPPIE